MAIMRVPTDYATIADAMLHLVSGDTLQLDPGYSNETASVTVSGITVTGDAACLGISLSLAAGVTGVTIQGAVPISVTDDAAGAQNSSIQSFTDGDTLVSVSGGQDIVHAGGIGQRTLSVDYALAANAITTTYFSADGGYYGEYTDGTANFTVSFGGPTRFVVKTGAGDDVIITGDADDMLSLGGGADTVTAGNGADTVDGGSGADRFIAESPFDGADTCIGGADSDTADYSALGVFNRIVVSLGGLSTVFVAGGDNDQLSGIENVTGGAANDVITGDAAVNTLRGGAGNDLLDPAVGNDFVYGEAGNDTMRGSVGADLYDGGIGVDTVNFAPASGVNVFLDGSGTNGKAAFGDTFVNVENILGGVGADIIVGSASANRLSGNNGSDILWGRGGADVLDGGSGSDRLAGQAGDDTLTGGLGADTFVFDLAPAAGGLDRATDFEAGIDKIEIDASMFGGGLAAGGGVQLVADAAPSAAGFASGVFLYNTTTGVLSYDADGQGAGAAVAFFRLQNLPVLSAADFSVVA